MKKIFLFTLMISVLALFTACSGDEETPEKVDETQGNSQTTEEQTNIDTETTKDTEETTTEVSATPIEVPELEKSDMAIQVTTLVGNDLRKANKEGLEAISGVNKDFFEKATEGGKYDIKKDANWAVGSTVEEIVENSDGTYKAKINIKLLYFENDPTNPLNVMEEVREYNFKKNGSEFILEI